MGSLSSSCCFMHAQVQQAGRAAICAALCSTLMVNGPARAAYLDEDIAGTRVGIAHAAVRLADSASPVLESLRAVSELDSLLARIVREADPLSLAKTLDAGREAFLSAPSAKLTDLRAELSELPLSSCTKVPLPSKLLEALGEPAQAALKPLPRTTTSICLPPRASLERMADTVAAADASKVIAFGEQAQATWKAAKKKAGIQLSGELNSKLIDAMQGAKLADRKRFKTAREEYWATSQALEALQRKAAEGPPKCYALGCTAKFEAGISIDDDLTGIVKKRFPTNYGF
jgi:hypothetical protein